MSDDRPDDAIRVGTPERERAISLLNDAFSHGYLQVVEFEERSTVIYEARTRGELRASVADLPVAGHLFPDAHPSGVVVPAESTAAPVEWEADWDSLRRKGVWPVPATMLVTGSAGTLDLDFSLATFPAPLVTLNLQMSTATVKIRVGPDQEIRVSDLDTSRMTKIKDKAGLPTRAGGAVIDVRGSLSGWSSMTVKRSG